MRTKIADLTKAELIAKLAAAEKRLAKLERAASPSKSTPAAAKQRGNFHAAYDNMLEGCQIMGFDWRYLYLNDVADQHNQRPKEELLGKKYMDMWPGIESTEVFAVIQRCMEERVSQSIENKFVFPNGSQGWFELKIYPVPEGIVIFSIDITAHKQVEEKLRTSEERYRRFFANMHETFIIQELVVDEADRPIDLRYLDVNPAAERILGKTRAEIVGRTRSQLTGRPDLEGVEMASRVASTGTPFHMVRYSPGFGGWFESFTYALEAGIVATLALDITERKRAEEALRKSEEQLNGIVVSAMDAIISVNTEQIVVLFNAAAEKMFGCLASEAIGKPLENFIPERFRAAHREHIRLFGETGVTNRAMNALGVVIGRRANDEEFPIEASISQIEIDGKKLYTVILRDITERKQAEDELRRSNAELEQFAYVASHDLQEPLRAVAGMVQLLGQRYKGQLDERADEYIGHAVDAATRMQNLINGLLDYSRVDRLGKSFEPTDVERTLNHALSNLQVAIKESNAQITHDPLPTIMADPGQLTRVLQNIIGNALKFRGERPLHIHISAENSESGWRFAVRDNGIGIDPQYFERIFLVFQRLHTRREYPGTGIGLALCKKIVERHGGQIWVESQPGQGSTFYFTIRVRRPW